MISKNIKESQRKYDVIPPKFRGIETDRNTEAYSGKSVFVYGDVGVGKSVFVSSLAKRIIDKGELKVNDEGVAIDTRQFIEWVNFPKFVINLKGGFDRSFDKSPWQIAKEVAEFRGWLVLDDLGVEKQTDFVKEITYYIINEREVNNGKIMITSNKGLEHLEDRIASRIAGMCEVLYFSGEDRRLL